MKTAIIYITLFFCIIQISYSQTENGVVALDIPARNSLMFNRFIENPTFSFVREQNKYISATNKRELLEIEDAPSSYLFNFSGRFKENIGAGLVLFQQNFGVFNTFGGVANYAYNVKIQEDSNLTFATNVGAYKSGINTGNVNVNNQDPSLNNVPSNFLATVSPSINYGSGFMDFGLTLSNVLTYNVNSSLLLDENAEKGIQGHIMYTGYLGGYGFFGESRFSALGKTEFQKNTSIISGVLMLTVPKGIWAQAGYNTIYGASGGLGVNLSPQFAIEYNYEKPFIGLSDLGSAHEITLAYRFKNNNYYDYSRDDEMAGLIMPRSRKKKSSKKKAVIAKMITKEENVPLPEIDAVIIEVEETIGNDDRDKIAAEKKAKAKAEADNRMRSAEVTKIKNNTDDQDRIDAEIRARAAIVQRATIRTENEAKAAEEELKRNYALAKEAEIQLKISQEAKPKEDIIEKTIISPTDVIGEEMNVRVIEATQIKKNQSSIMEALNQAVASKNKDLEDLREENDLIEEGKFIAPKPFKSISSENQAIDELKKNMEEAIIGQREEILALEKLYQQRIVETSDSNNETNNYFKDRIEALKKEQENTERSRASLLSTLDEIAEETIIERKRRIKRASFNNESDRFSQDKARLAFIKNNTTVSDTPIDADSFDFGDKRSSNIQILKNVANTENGFYTIIAVHNSAEKRDDFLTKVIASGSNNIDFFYDVITSKYYIYTERYDSIQEINQAIENNTNTIYNSNISIIKIEN